MKRRIKILSIDGGGIRGLVPALILAELEEKTGRLCSELFDLVGGTSTGAILTAGISIGIPCKEIAKIYIERGEEIFTKNKGSWWKFLINEKYTNKGLNNVMKEFLNDITFKETKVHALMTAYDIENRQNVVFSSRLSRDIKLLDGAIASACAPTYFEPHLVGGIACIDGGASGMNNPALICLDEAVNSFNDAEDPFLFSLGTGSFEKSIPYDKAKNWGVSQWIRPLIDVMMDGSSEMVHQSLSNFCTNYHRIQFSISSRKIAKMDDASKFHLDQLQGLARMTIQKENKRLNFIASKL
jgi:predicted patatin/cPLA2 family phospholipase